MASRLGNGKVRKDQTDHYGRIKEGGGAKVTDFQDSDSVTWDVDEETGKIFAEAEGGISIEDFEDTDSIVFSEVTGEEGKLQADLVRYDITTTDYKLLKVVSCTQTQYNNLTTKDVNTLYVIVG